MKSFKIAVFAFAFLFLSVLSFSLYAQNNPVLPGIADAGVINFNGKYYLAGVSTNGGFYISNDLIKWEGPVHVFSMNNDWTKGKPFGDNQIHAADIRYWNGKFHFYWSVNFWGIKNMVVHIGHAVSDNILGPYVEPEKKTWFDDRIDGNLFINTDSTFYFYSVKFTDGNTIWGQALTDPWTHKGDPKLMFNTLPDTWERVDNNVIEGPWVMKYRSRYFIMYNANHTSNLYGNYALGVAEADSPLGFNSANKYPQPVVQQNLTDNPDEMRYFFTSSLNAFTNWKYTFDNPADIWMNADFEDLGWKSGEKGFGNQIVKGSTITRPQTVWNSNDIWVRKHFKMEPTPSDNLQLLVNHAGPTEVYIDGELVYKGTEANYSTISLTNKVINKLKTGSHVIALHSKKGRRSANADVELADPLTKPGDDILLNPGQPNIIKGPNGFEWWLVYFGIKNGGRRGQFVDRVIFNNHELTVDGPTGSKTPGYHPNPSLPVFGDIFDYSDMAQFKAKWEVRSGKWQIHDSELKQTNLLSKSVALIKSHKAADYLFKIGIKNNTNTKANAGVIAYYANPANFLEVGFNKSEGTWYSKILKDGKESLKKNKLSNQFNFNVYHSISVFKNDKRFDILIDDNPAPGNNKIYSSFSAQGIPGIFTQKSNASFDGAIYTPGWDEYNSGITGWGNSQVGEKSTGVWKVSGNGLSLSESKGSFSVFKGDLLNTYEFDTQLYRNLNNNFQADKGMAGIYPVYNDQNNYLQVGLDFQHNKLIVSGKLNGKSTENTIVPLKRKIVKYPDPKYGDRSMKFYALTKNTELSSIEVVKSIYNKEDFLVNSFDSLKVFYRNNGEWHPLDFKVVSRNDQAVNKIVFSKITADAIKVTSAAVNNFVPLYKIYITEEKTSDYNIRTVKLKDRVILFLDGKQIAEVKGTWLPSQVGLFAKDAPVTYNGITLYEK